MLNISQSQLLIVKHKNDLNIVGKHFQLKYSTVIYLNQIVFDLLTNKKLMGIIFPSWQPHKNPIPILYAHLFSKKIHRMCMGIHDVLICWHSNPT